jgi:predicted dehydrogenase
VVGKVDAAILALPHHLHAPVASDLLAAGVHVLVEKPMAMSGAECDRMIAAAESSGAVLAVGVARRFYDAGRFIKRMLDSGMLGKIRRFDGREGFVYSWPVASDFMFRRDTGGGVLADGGAHMLDTCLWWLGDWESVEYFDDSRGGVEADCEVHLKMKSGAEGVVELSRTRDLRNTWIIEGEHGTLEVDSIFNPLVRLRLRDANGDQEFELTGHALREDGEDEPPLACFNRQMIDFVDAIEQGRPPRASGSEGKRSVELIEACLANRRPLEHAWTLAGIS